MRLAPKAVETHCQNDWTPKGTDPARQGTVLNRSLKCICNLSGVSIVISDDEAPMTKGSGYVQRLLKGSKRL